MDSGPYFDPEYETLSARMNAPIVVIDNSACEHATVVKVDSVNTHGVLLEVVQVLAELDLCIIKAYIASDGGWLLDVFHVTDQKHDKVTDSKIIDHIKKAISAQHDSPRSEARGRLGEPVGKTVGVQSIAEHTAIELTGTDRPGLLSEISAVLTDLHCNVKHVEVWTHNMRVACVVYVTDERIGGPVVEPAKLARIRELLCNVMKGKDDRRGAKTEFALGLTNTERRLHQMMFADRDYEGEPDPTKRVVTDGKPRITVQNCKDNNYSIVNVESIDRPKLLFDTVCTLTDMEYVVFHANINSGSGRANQEYYIRHMDGRSLDSEAEKQRVIKCLEAAIERRVSDGLKLELHTTDRIGLLSEVTRIFRENGLSVARADVETKNNQAVNLFFVTDTTGNPVDSKTVETLRREMEICQTMLKVTEVPRLAQSPPPNEPVNAAKGFSLGSILKAESWRFLYSFGSFGFRSV